VTADLIVAALLKVPTHSVEEARTDAPEEPGFYAWWCNEDELPHGVPLVRHPELPLGLLYVGVAPDKDGSANNLRKRLRQHTKGAIGSSTFRFGLAALLFEDMGWLPHWPATKPILENRDLAALSDWQEQNLQVQWVEVNQPWTVEAAVIDALGPAMNRAHNERHEFYPAMGAARNALWDAARKRRELDA
jgi:hypothetical protein